MTSGTGIAAARWRKSSYSGGGNQCIEVATVRGRQVAVRDSKNPSAGEHVFSAAAWHRFLYSVQQADL